MVSPSHIERGLLYGYTLVNQTAYWSTGRPRTVWRTGLFGRVRTYFGLNILVLVQRGGQGWSVKGSNRLNILGLGQGSGQELRGSQSRLIPS